MADSTLAAIRKKVRLLTRKPSVEQISNADIDEYINTFVLYDLPQELRLETLKDNLTFYTEPGIDTYETNSTALDPFNDFKDKYTAVVEPAFVAGYRARFFQSQAEFYNVWPFTNTEETIASGDGATFIFSGTLSSIPILRGKVTISMVDTVGDSKKVYDDGDGILSGDGTGTIDYLTGAWDITWTDAVGAGEPIIAMTYPYTAARPDSILFFSNKFVLRPVPDKVYPVQVGVYFRPTELIAVGQSPELEQWWQLLAYGAATKIFQDGTDMDSVAEIAPEFNKQMRLALRRTLVQQSKQRSATIYSSAGFDRARDRFRSNY